MIIKKIKKYFEYFITIFIRKISEKVFKYKNEKIKYIFYQNKKSKNLVVVFSSCTRNGIKARYNYIRTLKNVKENKLFILDDGGIDRRGTYYLGKYPEFDFEKGCKELIGFISKKINVNKYFLIGSSKGGYCSILFGMDLNNCNMIVGAPQYYLGTYLASCYKKVTLRSLNCDDEDRIKYLDNLLKNKIKNLYGNKVFIQYSVNDPTYKNHICYMLDDMKKNGVCVVEEKLNYTNHDDVSIYFPDYIKKILDENLNERK